MLKQNPTIFTKQNEKYATSKIVPPWTGILQFRIQKLYVQ